MTRSTLRRTSAAAVAVLALASLAACGGDDDGGDNASSESSESTSADATDGASDASDDATDDASDDPSDEASKKDDPGAPDMSEGEEVEPTEFIEKYAEALDQATTARLVMSFGGDTPVKGKGAADFTTDPPSMHLIMKDASTGTEQRMIIVDGIMYLGLEKNKYLSYDLSDPDSPLGTDLIDQLDPSSMADVFEDGMTGSRFIGEEEKQGEPMQHYRVAVDAAAVFDDANAGSNITFDVWFDDEGFLRQQQAGLGAGAGAVELTYEDWGADVDIKAPPASQVSQLPTS